ncbi:hypothetical protein Ciccas_000828, partial [Cichlidogyrus casuarinus]
KPTITKFPSKLRVLEGQDVLFICEATSNPSATFAFEWDGQTLPAKPVVDEFPSARWQSVPLARKTSDNMATLRMLAEMRMSNKRVACLAKNQMGNETQVATLEVFPKDSSECEFRCLGQIVCFEAAAFPKAHILKTSIDALMGSDVTIECQVSNAASNAKVLWIKNHSDVVSSSSKSFLLR